MRVEIEIDDLHFAEVVCKDLKWHYDNFAEGGVFYSKDKEEEEKEVKKMRKALKKVINFYSKPSEQIE
jgi:hypothetical protein